MKILLQLLEIFVRLGINLNSLKSAPQNCMETLTLQDTQNLHQGIQKLYTLRNLDTFGVAALTIMNQLVPSDIPTFHITYVRTHQTSDTFLPDFPGFTPEMERVRLQHFGKHPIAQHMPYTLNGAYKLSDFVSQKELHWFEGLYQQFLRLVDVEDQIVFFLPNANPGSWCNLSQTDATLVGFALHRPQRNFTERDRLILNLLRPHLAQAYSNAQHYHQFQQQLTQLHQCLNSLGLIILNGIGQIQFRSPSATQWLQTYFTKSTHTDHLPDHLWAWVRHQISSFTNNHLLTADIPLCIEQADKKLVIRFLIEQIGECYLLILEEQTVSGLNSLELLGLTQREADVLLCVIRGKDNKAIARHLSVHPSTIRKHLESIYRKLRVQSRTEAIAHTLETLGILNSLPSI